MGRIAPYLLMVLLFVAGTCGAAETVEGPGDCARCGMNRTTFAYSRMLVTYADGKVVGVCSLHCAVEETRSRRDRQVVSLLVADYGTRRLIDARKAVWVVGGKERGVMTHPAKWAFGREEDARAFVREKGGEIVPFEAVLKSVTAEVEEMERVPELDAVDR